MKIDDQLLIDTTKTCLSMNEAAAKLGMNLMTFKRHAIRLEVWSPNTSGKGVKKPKGPGRDKFDLQDILDGKHPQYASHKLRLRLFAAGLKENKCEECSIDEWQGKPISMHLEHIDGNHYNHRLENLKILCPNCHSQTPTFGSKKRLPL